jgi:hypothetical protein
MAFKSRVYKQAVDLQRLLVTSCQREDASASAKAAAANAFANLEYLKRCMRMKPNPRPADVPLATTKGLIDYKALVKRPKAIIDVSEPKPSGVKDGAWTSINSSPYYAPKKPPGDGQPAPSPSADPPTASGAQA